MLRRFKIDDYQEMKRLYEIGTAIKEIAEKYDTGQDYIRRVLKGDRGGGHGKVDSYKKSKSYKNITELVIEAYNNNVPVYEICNKFDINLRDIQIIRERNKIPKRGTHNPISKTLTVEYNGSIHTFLSLTQASEYLKISEDILKRAKYGNFYNKFNTAELNGLHVIHDFNDIEKMETVCELVSNILTKGSVTNKKDWGNQVSNLLIELGYLDKDIFEYNKHFENEQ